MQNTKAKYSIKIKYTDTDGNVVDREFGIKNTVFYEFVAQGQMFYVQTLVTDQKVIEKDSVATLDNFYVPTKNILSLQVAKTLKLSDNDKAQILLDMFGVEPKVNTTVAPENEPAVDNVPTA